MTPPSEAVRLLRDARRVLLCSHVPPDGDGLGSALAIIRHLRARGREAIFAAGGPVQGCLRFLYDEDEVDVTPGGPSGDFDLGVALDSGSFARLGPAGESCRETGSFLAIDHHATNELYGDVNWVEPRASAVGEMIFALLGALGAEMTEALALPLYVALVTDTGRFGYSNTTPECLDTAASLLRTGIRPELVTDRIYRSHPEGFLRLWGAALAGLETEAGGLVAHLTATPEMIEASGADPLDVGDLIDLLISMDGVEVAVLFRAAPDGRGTKLSLRSRTWFPVHEFAGRFGGGGHPRAAGATVPLPPAEARRAVLDALVEELARRSGGDR